MWRKLAYGLLLAIVMAPLLSFAAWYFSTKKQYTVAIVDKTVLNTEGQEHSSLHWVLNHNRFVKTADSRYQVNRDYFGFFPKEDTLYELKGLERFSAEALNVLSDDADLLYLTDTYGIYKQEWFARYTENKQGILYGGLSQQDLEFVKLMKRKHKPVITEFNCLASPTPQTIRNEFETLYKLHFTGWTGRYFDSLDETKNKELPQWILTNYKSQNKSKWDFKKDGLVLVHESGTIVILENGRDLNEVLPVITASEKGIAELNLPKKEVYPFWFEIIENDSQVNRNYASFNLDVNSSGKSKLEAHQIPSVFPAVVGHPGPDYIFYYMAGDFSDNPVGFTTSYFKGISLVKGYFYNADEPSDRGGFFFNFYKPMLTKILKKAYHSFGINKSF